MKIEPLSLTVRQLCEGYADHAEDGVVAYGGRLDVRPKCQREFIYSEKQQQAVVNTAMHGWPLSTMYWAVRGDGTFEVIDGQESALSIRKFTDSQKRSAYERQGGKCAVCGKAFAYEEMHGDHKTPWSKGGHTTPDNLQMLCRTCNLRKGNV